MQELIQDYQNQLSKFQQIRFEADGHRYSIDGLEAQSVTSILSKLVKPFARDYWANLKSKQLGITPAELLAQWDFKAKLSQVKGTLVHSLLESHLTQSEFIYPEDRLLNMFGYDPVQDSFNQIASQVEKFIGDIADKMLPIASELVIGDKDSLVCGTIDQLFFNRKSAKLEIWDWKTNKEIKTMSQYFHLTPIEHIPDTELDHYSLQLSLYKLILQKATGVEVGECYLTWFNETQTEYKIFRTKNYLTEAQYLLEWAND